MLANNYSMNNLSPPLINKIKKTEKEIIWLAGFTDGEGYIGITRQRKKETFQHAASLLYHPYLIITNTNCPVLLDIKKYIQDGYVYEMRRKRRKLSNEKLSFQYKLTKMDKLKVLLDNLRPYLRLKQQQCDLLLDFIDIRKQSRRITGRGHRGVTSFSNPEEEIYQKLLILNKRGK